MTPAVAISVMIVSKHRNYANKHVSLGLEPSTAISFLQDTNQVQSMKMERALRQVFLQLRSGRAVRPSVYSQNSDHDDPVFVLIFCHLKWTP